jgi:hypothetical protein
MWLGSNVLVVIRQPLIGRRDVLWEIAVKRQNLLGPSGLLLSPDHAHKANAISATCSTRSKRLPLCLSLIDGEEPIPES